MKIWYVLLFAIILAACTDYVNQIEDERDEWRTAQELAALSSNNRLVSSSSVVPTILWKSSSSEKANTTSSSVNLSGDSHEESSSSFSLKNSSSSAPNEVSSASKLSWNFLNPNISYGVMVDNRDNQVYKTVKIGEQIWMAENLNFNTIGSNCYENSKDSCAKYGSVYQWSDAMDSIGEYSANGRGCGSGALCSPFFPVQGLCPSGWHVPDTLEWKKLFAAVGGQYKNGTVVNTAGAFLKSKKGWYESGNENCNGTDDYGFSAISASMLQLDGFNFRPLNSTRFWTSIENEKNIGAYAVSISDCEVGYSRFENIDKKYGISVRCLKNDLSVGKSSSSDMTKSSSSIAPCKTKTEDKCEYGSLTDERDGRTYKTVKIGNQEWMAENLNFEAPNSHCYDEKMNNCDDFGRLYTWAVAVDSVGLFSANGKGCGYGLECTPILPTQGVCPSNWHLPTKEEFDTLLVSAGGVSVATEMLKSTSGWYRDSNGTDAWGFSALPAGMWKPNGSAMMSSRAHFWTVTENHTLSSYCLLLNFAGESLLYGEQKWYGLSVRCVKNKLSDLQSSSTSALVESSSSILSSSSKASWAYLNPAISYGEMTDDRDGQVYKIVEIGEQTWMVENLNYESVNSHCFNDSTQYCAKYGRYYTWAAAMDSAGIWSPNGKGCGDSQICSPTYPVRGICAKGWHLPTSEEWSTLLSKDDFSKAGQMLKSAVGWIGNQNGIDSYGFSIIPAGNKLDGYSWGQSAYFWTSTEYNRLNAYYIYFEYDNGNAPQNDYKSDEFSVRCVKD